jgi:hypothetical protein
VVEAGTVRRLLETIEQRLSRLEQATGTPLEVYENDADLQDVINERVYAALGELNDVRSYVEQLDRYLGDE